MLLIRCPYCGRAPGARVPLRRRGAYRAPGRHRRRSATRTSRSSSSSAPTRRACIFERWRHIHGCGRFFNAVRDTVTDKFVIDLQGRRAEARHRDARGDRGLRPPPSVDVTARAAKKRRMMTAPSASPAAAASTARKTAALHLRRQSLSTALAGDTLASALLANGVHLVGRSFKYHRPRGILSAGAEEPNALVTVERDAARKTPNVRATVQELYDGLTRASPEPLAVARLRRRRGQRPRLAAVLGRLLLQDLHVAEGGLEERSTSRTSARPPASASRPTSPIPTTTRRAIAHCDVLVVGGGAGRPRRGARGGRDRRARHPLRRAGRARRRAALRDAARRSTARPAGTGRRRRIAKLAAHGECRAAAAHHGVRLLRPELRRPGRARHRPSRRARPRRCRASGCGRCAPGRSCSPPARSSGRMVFADNDRPGVMLASAARTYLNHYGVAVGRKSASTPPTTAPMRRRSTSRRPASTIAAIVDLRDNPTGPAVDEARGARHRGQSRPRGGRQARGKLRVSSMIGAAEERRRASAPSPVDALLMSAGWTPSVHLFSQSRGKVAFDDATQALPARRPMRRTASRSAPATAPSASRDASTKAIAAGAKAAKDAGGKAGKGAKLDGRRRRKLDRRHAGRGAGRRRRHDGQGLRRLPERRHRQGHPPGGARGHALDRARQALHHQRHGDRPGQDLQHARPGDRRRGARQGRSPRSASPPSARPTRR